MIFLRINDLNGFTLFWLFMSNETIEIECPKSKIKGV